MGNLLRRDGSGTSLKEMTDTEVGKYFGYYNLLEYVGLADSNEVGRLTTKKICCRKYNDVGTFTDTFFNEPVGTAPGTSITSGSTTYRLYQRYDSSYAMADSDLSLYRPLMWVDGGGQTGFKQVPESDLNANIDKALTYHFTNDGLGTYRLSEASPGVGYTDRGTVATDTQTDGTTVNYKIWQRTGNASSFYQANAIPLYVNKSYTINYQVNVANPGSGNYFYLNGTQKPAITTQRLNTYIFDQSDASNDDHPLVFKNSSTPYNTGVTYYLNGSSTSYSNYYTTSTFNSGRGSGGTDAGKLRRYVKIVIDAAAPASGLRYYCYVHGEGMGNTIATQDRSEQSAAESFSVRDLDSADVRLFRKTFQRRIQESKIGTYQLRTSSQGAPTDAGTWVSKGAVTDTKKTTADVAYVAAFANTFNINYVAGYQNEYTVTYTRVYEGGDESDVPGETGYLKDYTSGYQTAYVRAYTGTFEEVYGGVQDGPAYTASYTIAYERDFETTFLAYYARNFTNYFQQNYVSIFATSYIAASYTGFTAYIKDGGVESQTGSYIEGGINVENVYFQNLATYPPGYYLRKNIYPDYYPNYQTAYTREFYLGLQYYQRSIPAYYERQVNLGPVYMQGPPNYLTYFSGYTGTWNRPIDGEQEGTGSNLRLMFVQVSHGGNIFWGSVATYGPYFFVQGGANSGVYGDIVQSDWPYSKAYVGPGIIGYVGANQGGDRFNGYVGRLLSQVGTYARFRFGPGSYFSGSSRPGQYYGVYFGRVFLGLLYYGTEQQFSLYKWETNPGFVHAIAYTGVTTTNYTNENAGNYYTTGFGPLVYYENEYQGQVGFESASYAPGSNPYFNGYLRVYTSSQPAALMYVVPSPQYERDIASYQRLYTSVYARNYTGSFINYYTTAYTGAYVGTYETNYDTSYISTVAGDYTGTFESVYERIEEEQDYVSTYVTLYAGDFEGTFDGTAFNAYYEQDYQQGYIQEYLTDFEGTTIQASSGTEETYTLYVRIS